MIKTWWNKKKCQWGKHAWQFDGGRWILRDVSMTTRKCSRCGLKQDIEHYHLLPNYTRGEPGVGVSALSKERRPGDNDYDFKYEMNDRMSVPDTRPPAQARS